MGFLDKLKDVAKATRQAISDSGIMDEVKNKLNDATNIVNDECVAETVLQENEFEKNDVIEFEIVTDFELSEISTGEYEIVTFIGFTTGDINMEIPSEIDGQRIVRIGDEALANVTAVKNIKICDGIQEIGDRAFFNCSQLESIILPETLKKIGEKVFFNTLIKKLEIPDSTFEIGSGICECNEYLQYIKFPKQLETIPESVCQQCTGLKRVDFPENVLRVCKNAFDNCGGLELENIPSTCTILEEKAFNGCFSNEEDPDQANPIEEMKLPNNLISIGKEALGGINCLKLVIPASVKNIEKEAFAYCIFTREIYIETGCTAEIPESCFSNAFDLIKITIPSSITKIHTYAFAGLNDKYIYEDVKDEYGRQVYDEDGEIIKKTKLYQVMEEEMGEDFVIYCEPGSAAMQFAREKGFNCAKA